MPRALSVRLFSPAWLCQFLSTTPLGVTPPSQLTSLLPSNYTKSTQQSLPPWATCTINSADSRLEQALLCHCLPTPIRTFFFCPGNLAPTPWVDQITLLKSTSKSFSCPSPPPQPNQFFLHPLFTTSSTTIPSLPASPTAPPYPPPPPKKTLRKK